MKTKSAAQTLFDRLMVTWIYPEIERRVNQNLVTPPLNLIAALLLWEDLHKPSILLNDEADNSIIELQAVLAKPILPGESVAPEMIKGLGGIKLADTLRNYPFIFFIQAANGRVYLLSKKMSRITQTRDFEVLHQSLATEGVQISPGDEDMQVYFDFIRNQYDNLPSPTLKRRTVIRLAESLVDSVKGTATTRVKRHLRLPTLLVHRDDEFLPLLNEARQTYIDGHFFSCIASTATTADRICNRLSQRFGLPIPIQKWFLNQTLGNKISKLRAERLITKDQEQLLDDINKIRNRHLHPRHSISAVTLKRDAFKAVSLLHQLLEGTFSVYRDHTFAQGKIVPKPLV